MRLANAMDLTEERGAKKRRRHQGLNVTRVSLGERLEDGGNEKKRKREDLVLTGDATAERDVSGSKKKRQRVSHSLADVLFPGTFELFFKFLVGNHAVFTDSANKDLLALVKAGCKELTTLIDEIAAKRCGTASESLSLDGQAPSLRELRRRSGEGLVVKAAQGKEKGNSQAVKVGLKTTPGTYHRRTLIVGPRFPPITPGSASGSHSYQGSGPGPGPGQKRVLEASFPSLKDMQAAQNSWLTLGILPLNSPFVFDQRLGTSGPLSLGWCKNGQVLKRINGTTRKLVTVPWVPSGTTSDTGPSLPWQLEVDAVGMLQLRRDGCALLDEADKLDISDLVSQPEGWAFSVTLYSHMELQVDVRH